MYPPFLTVPLVLYIFVLTREAPSHVHRHGRTAVWSAPNETPGKLALRHELDTIPLSFDRQYTWSDPSTVQSSPHDLKIRF